MTDPHAERPRGALERALAPFADVRSGEGGGVLLLALNAFLLLTAYYLIKPVREALILTGGGAEVKRLFAQQHRPPRALPAHIARGQVQGQGGDRQLLLAHGRSRLGRPGVRRLGDSPGDQGLRRRQLRLRSGVAVDRDPDRARAQEAHRRGELTGPGRGARRSRS